MKKYCVWVMVCILSACHYNKEFKNPIFNQPLRPLSRTVGYTYLTPTSIDFRTPLDKNKVDSLAKCDLLENQEDRITLKCVVEGWGKVYNKYYTYVIRELFFSSCLRIEGYNYDSVNTFPKYGSSYCVTPPSQQVLESD